MFSRVDEGALWQVLFGYLNVGLPNAATTAIRNGSDR